MKTRNLLLVLCGIIMMTGLMGFEITQTKTFTGTPNYSSDLTFNKFDNTEGQVLVSVTVSMELNSTNFFQELDNDSGSVANVTAFAGASGSISSTDVSLMKDGFVNPVVAALEATDSQAYELAADDGDGQGFHSGGPDYDTFDPDDAQDSDSGDIATAAHGGYIGSDTYVISVSTAQSFYTTGSGGVAYTASPGTASGFVRVVYNYTGDEILPVELSSFTATQTFENYANINWVTQSENNISGFNVYRNVSDLFIDSYKLNSSILAGTNSSTIESYDFSDISVERGNTYFYWLESVDFNGTTETYGPISLFISNPIFEDEGMPELVMNEGIGSIFPNPFNPSTSISFYLKDNSVVELKVLDIKGRLVRTLINNKEYSGGSHHNFTWNGKNDDGKVATSGVYFFKLNAGSVNQIKRAVLVK